ncbi:LysR family transcriptional regulator [Hoeflea sp. TYP-13]|uniref:LysR family transcriptional regulator n=1 Tax=Hoeflea sp. TYP-13 TaxID=3230023 RepID=UPI0034C6400D
MAGAGLPPLTWLRAFETAARHLSFTQAAAELNLTQSAVSQHVRSLEGFLGRELFIRRTRALHLTEAGSNYLPIVQEAFDVLAVGTRTFTGGNRGQRLMVKCNLAFSIFWLAPRLSGLMDAHPWLTLNITTPIWDPEATEGTAEVEIRFGRPATMPKTARRLSRETAYPVCAPALSAEMADWQTARLFDCAGVLTNWETWLASQGHALQKDRQVNLASTYVVAMTAVQHGAGLAMSHDTLATGLLSSGALVTPYDHRIEMPEAYFLLSSPSHEETPAVRAFTDWVGRQFDLSTKADA